MTYITYYDFAGIAVLAAVIFHFFYKKTISTRQTRAFTRLVLVAVAANALDLITVYTITHSSQFSLWLNYLLNGAYLVFFNLLPPMYLVYVFTVVNQKAHFDFKREWIFFVPTLVIIGLVITTPVTGIIFYFDQSRLYCHGPLMNSLYMVAFLYIILTALLTAIYRPQLNFLQKFTLVVYTCSIILAVYLQMQNRSFLVIHFAVAIVVLMVYLSLENPESYKNPILGIYNHSAFMEVLSTLCHYNKSFSVIGIKIDNARYVNEMMGNESLQQLLKNISQYLIHKGGNDSAFFLGDNKFALVLQKSKNVNSEQVIEEIHKGFLSPFPIRDTTITLDTTLCTFSFPEQISRLEDVTDMLTYSFKAAKSIDTKTVYRPDSSILEHGRREQQIIHLIKEGMRSDMFEVFYQPIFSVKEQRFTSAEALVRMKNTSIGYVSPDEFIPLAEQNGMITELGKLVFEKVCHFMAEHSIWEKGIDSIHVNLSTVQCIDERLYESFMETMNQFGLDHTHIDLEITETAAILSSDKLMSTMEKLIGKGISFSLDDYGSGLSNLSYIINYPFNTIKLDKSMVTSSTQNKKYMGILKHTIAMIKEMDMNIIAEGIETKEQSELLTSLGCDYFQGYYYSKPIGADDFLELLK